MTGVQTCALPICFPVTIGGDLGLSAIRATGGSVQRAFFDKTTESVRVVPATASYIGLVVRAATSQTANLQEWQDSSGTVLTGITYLLL